MTAWTPQRSCQERVESTDIEELEAGITKLSTVEDDSVIGESATSVLSGEVTSSTDSTNIRMRTETKIRSSWCD